jgi:hypothetical protein
MTNTTTFNLWLDAIHKIPLWVLVVGISFLALTIFSVVFYQLFKIYQLNIFHAFEKIKLKEKDIEHATEHSTYIEITIPKNSQVTAFQVQQKILKALHAIYADPIEGPHKFSPYLYFFQKLYRRWKVNRKQQVFFTLQIWAQYPSLFR